MEMTGAGASRANGHARLGGARVPRHLSESSGEELRLRRVAHARLGPAVAIAVPRAVRPGAALAILIGAAARTNRGVRRTSSEVRRAISGIVALQRGRVLGE